LSSRPEYTYLTLPTKSQSSVYYVLQDYDDRSKWCANVATTAGRGDWQPVMTKSDLNEYIGDIGPYQWRVFIVVFLFTIYCTDSIQIIFLGADMTHWCRVPEIEDLPYDVQKNVAIPAQSTDGGGSVEYSSCEMFSLNYSVYNRSQFYSWNRSLMITNETTTVKCSEWTYDQSQFTSTIVSKVQKHHLLLHRSAAQITLKTRWLYCVECPQYSIRLEKLSYLCDCISGRGQR